VDRVDEYPGIDGGFRNSAPIQITLNFGGYKERTAWDLQHSKIGESKECLETVMDGHVQVEQALKQDATSEDKEQVAKLFNVCNESTVFEHDKNIKLFLGDGVIEIPVQSNDPVDPTSNMEHVSTSHKRFCAVDLCGNHIVLTKDSSSTSSPSIAVMLLLT
jgi:hypothetical protein